MQDLKLSTKKISFLSFLVLFLFTGCRYFEDFSEQNAQLENLEHKLDSLEKRYEQIDFTSIYAVKETVMMELDSVKKICKKHNLELTLEEGIFFGKYKGITAPIRKAGVNEGVLFREIELSKSQLKNLRADLENRVHEKEKMIQFLADEKEALDNLEQGISKFESGGKMLLNKFKEMRVEVNSKFKSLHKRARE